MLIFLVFCAAFVSFVLVLCLVRPMLPMSRDCPFLIVPSVFSTVYLLPTACFVFRDFLFGFLLRLFVFMLFDENKKKTTIVGVVPYLILVNHQRKLSNPSCRPFYLIFHGTRHISIIAFYYLVNISTKTGLYYIVRIIMTGY